MQPSNDSRGATPDLTEGLVPHCAPTAAANASAGAITCLPPADRVSQLSRWGIGRDSVGSRFHGHGPEYDTRADEDDAEEAGFLVEGGWSIATLVEGGGRGHGLTTHRGVLHPDEYVDEDDLRALVSEHLGFTIDEVRSVYRQGRMSDEGRALRARIDARLLEIAESGGLMTELGRALGWTVKDDGHCRTMENALARARAGEVTR